MNLALTELLFALILLIAAYFISHTINGYLQAAIANALGDSTAKDLGYQSLNPLVHIDVFGLVALIFFFIGWFQSVPIDPYAFKDRWRDLKLFTVFFSEMVISIIFAVLALFASVALFGYCLTTHLIFKIFTFFSKSFMVYFTTTAHLNIAHLFNQYHSSFAVVIAFLLISIVYLNILIAMVSLVFNAFRYALVVGFERGYSYIQYAEYLSMLGPFLVVWLFGDYLIQYLLVLTNWLACHMAHFVGVLS